MKQSLKLTGLAVLLGIATAPAAAQEKIKIGVITTLSGPAAVLGQQSRDGLQLGIKDLGGKMAQDRGYKRMYVLVPNYQAGKDSAAGFKLDYKGEIAEESYTPLGTLDFQVELTKIASSKVDALFTFMPGGMGVGLVKQYRQAGLADKIPVLSAFTVDESTLPAQQDAAVGMFGGANWAPDMD